MSMCTDSFVSSFAIWALFTDDLIIQHNVEESGDRGCPRCVDDGRGKASVFTTKCDDLNSVDFLSWSRTGS